MERPKLDQMTAVQRIKYLKDTDHSVVKWVNRMNIPHGLPSNVVPARKYHRDYLPHLTTKLSEATIYDTRLQANNIAGFTLVSVTKKKLFKAKLANK